MCVSFLVVSLFRHSRLCRDADALPTPHNQHATSIFLVQSQTQCECLRLVCGSQSEQSPYTYIQCQTADSIQTVSVPDCGLCSVETRSTVPSTHTRTKSKPNSMIIELNGNQNFQSELNLNLSLAPGSLCLSPSIHYQSIKYQS